MICIPEKIIDIFFAGLGSFVFVLFSVIAYYAKKYHFFLEEYYKALAKSKDTPQQSKDLYQRSSQNSDQSSLKEK